MIGSYDEFRSKSYSWANGMVTDYHPLDSVETLSEDVLTIQQAYNYSYTPKTSGAKFAGVCQKKKGMFSK